jgi:hypothetical protein
MMQRTASVQKREQKSSNGTVVRVWFECSGCGYAVGPSDPFCRHCGVRLLGVKV